MTSGLWIEAAAYFGLIAILAPPLGRYLARVYTGRAELARRMLSPLERGIYRLAGVDEHEEMGWRRYAASLLLFNGLGLIALYLFQRLQSTLPLNPAGLGPVGRWVALNTAVSFVTNTNWQAYSGETTMSLLTQMAALTVQNFLSAATGMAVAAALARGVARHGAAGLGSFWVDLTRGVLYLLLPLALVLALALASQGVVQTFAAATEVTLLDPPPAAGGAPAAAGRRIALGPVASQVAIKQLGTNGGGFTNTNSAHPLENPTPLSNFLEVTAILLLPAAMCFTFAAMVGASRHGWALLAAMVLLLLLPLALCLEAETGASPAAAGLPLDLRAGNMEGKEVRFGAAASALWAVATTAASNGSVNAMHDSFTALGGLAPLWLMHLGEVAFGGIGSGLYGLIMFATIAVFLAGLMVGRTPEMLGKKLEAYEMKMASLTVLIPAACILVGTALGCGLPGAAAAAPNPGSHGFSEILYAFTSGGQNNGSAFAGLDAARPFYAGAIAVCMLAGRYGVILPVLAIAGSLARKRRVPASSGTLPTDSLAFVLLLVFVVVLTGALTYFPALALGPIAEHLEVTP